MARKLVLIGLGPTEGTWQRALGYESECEVIGAEVTMHLRTSQGEETCHVFSGLSPMPSCAQYRFSTAGPSSVYIHLA